MLFIFLCFLGMLAVLFHMLRSQERLCRILQDEHAQMRVLLRAMESRLDALSGVDGPAPRPTGAAPAHDPLLRLSFEEPLQPGRPGKDEKPATDPALDLHFDPLADDPANPR
ncbi:hypothetical protein [Desulfovibrio sp. SGI.169]|uniref:hypothetical protein n=1 Tax=Desulfovibrio sp. SGI.169 TaxID=3420561 RepID=UPI003D015D82